VGRGRQKLFEIYDRIAMGAIGHPGDIERLRMAAIELASTEGFTRSAADVSLRRLAFYSLSPLLKTAFEQVYGAPFLARMIFCGGGDNGGGGFVFAGGIRWCDHGLRAGGRIASAAILRDQRHDPGDGIDGVAPPA
jgi:20S proteasome alpha/beta subunit